MNQFIIYILLYTLDILLFVSSITNNENINFTALGNSVHCTLNSLHCTMNSVHCTVNSVHCTVNSVIAVIRNSHIGYHPFLWLIMYTHADTHLQTHTYRQTHTHTYIQTQAYIHTKTTHTNTHSHT